MASFFGLWLWPNYFVISSQLALAHLVLELSEFSSFNIISFSLFKKIIFI